jgi:hypothetical protein
MGLDTTGVVNKYLSGYFTSDSPRAPGSVPSTAVEISSNRSVVCYLVPIGFYLNNYLGRIQLTYIIIEQTDYKMKRERFALPTGSVGSFWTAETRLHIFGICQIGMFGTVQCRFKPQKGRYTR